MRPAGAFYSLPVETLTFLFTDIEGSTALLRRLGEGAYTQVLASHHALIRSALAAHGGREVDTQGDAFFAVFSSPAAAESCDAVALFAERARAQGVGLRVDEQTAPVLVSICRQLDGMPLAIELAAARLRSLSLSDLHDRLGQRFRLLTGGSRTALERQQTLRATVDWSYSLLTGAEQLLLRRLSMFIEGFDLDAAEAVCGFGDIEVFDVADLLGSPACMRCAQGTCPPPGLTWNRRREPHGRSGRKAPPWRSTWAGCGARTATRTARGSCSRRACGSAAATETAPT